jgi:hypothetical protein
MKRSKLLLFTILTAIVVVIITQSAVAQPIVTVNNWRLAGMLATCDSLNTKNFWSEGYQTFDQYGIAKVIDNKFILTTHWVKDFWIEYYSIPDTLKWDVMYILGHSSAQEVYIRFAIQDSNTYIWWYGIILIKNGEWQTFVWDMEYIKSQMSNFGRIYLSVIVYTGQEQYTGVSVGVRNLRGIFGSDSVIVYDTHQNPVSVNPNIENPHVFVLNQNYPNPFNPSTTISYSLPERSFVNIKIYDILGREIAEVVNEEREVGVHNINFNGSGLPSGHYVYVMTAGGNVTTKKMTLVK